MRRFIQSLIHPAIFLMSIAMAACSVSAADLVCNFRGKGLSLNFGSIDPSVPQTITSPINPQMAFADEAGDCVKGGSMTISIVGSSPLQLVGGVNTINYTVSGFPVVLPKPGNAPGGRGSSNGWVTWFAPNQLRGSILWSDYANAPAGNYVGNITLAVDP